MDNGTVLTSQEGYLPCFKMSLKISYRRFKFKKALCLKLKSPRIQLPDYFSRQPFLEQLALELIVLIYFKLFTEEFCLPVVTNFHF
jgi:hypothetical protein